MLKITVLQTTAEKQRQEFKDVEEGQLKKFSMIEGELKQMKTSKIISEKLAPDDIFSRQNYNIFAESLVRFK